MNIDPILEFLRCRTPDAWLSWALNEPELMLIDHANCEYKAAATGMSLITKHRNKPSLQRLMARLVREEMLHYEQVLVLMDQMGVNYRPLTASRYAKTLREAVRSDEDGRLVDTLLVGAIVEARSCERFAALWPRLPIRLGKFYKSLLRSEGRHYQDYLSLAREFADTSDVEQRLIHFLEIDQMLIETSDDEFRVHSGVPA